MGVEPLQILARNNVELAIALGEAKGQKIPYNINVVGKKNVVFLE